MEIMRDAAGYVLVVVAIIAAGAALGGLWLAASALWGVVT